MDVQSAGTQVLRRLGAAGDAVRKAVAGRTALVARGHIARQEAVARADGRKRFQSVDLNLVMATSGTLSRDRRTARLPGDDRLARPHLDQASQAHCDVVGVVELVADRLLRLGDIRS